MHSRGIYNSFNWFNVVHYSSLFQYFFFDLLWSLLLLKIPNILVYLFVNFFVNIIIMIMIIWLKYNIAA